MYNFTLQKKKLMTSPWKAKFYTLCVLAVPSTVNLFVTFVHFFKTYQISK